MNCPSCGTVNEQGRKFCAECGARLAANCPSCGTANRPDAKFCGECGTALTAVDSTGSAATPAIGRPRTETAAADVVAERKFVSVLFADLVGFTALSESRDPEEVRELLSRYFDRARVVIERYGGTVEKFIGDAVMAVWGTPVAHEDDAERAVRAALELVAAVEGLAHDVGSDDLKLRAAVLSGEAAVNLGATGQGMVAGDLVNTASRLQGAAAPGMVLVGESTYRATKDAIAFEPAGEQSLKGKALPVQAWRALRVVALRRGERRAEGLEAPFVGRDEEFRLLKESLHATTREGKSRLVSIIGQAGIGKSRLAWEFLKYIDGLTEDVYWHEGRSPAYGEATAYWALGEMVRRRAGIAETEDADSTRQKLAETLRDYIADDAERTWVEPRVAALLGVEAMPAGEREQLFAAWRTFFERVADRGTTVLVFEELQWADNGLLDFIEHLLEWSRQKPILVVTLARPELLERHAAWGTAQRAFAAVHLEPLGEAEMRKLLSGLVPGLPEPIVQRVLQRAEGIPLYAVETVRMLVDAGRLVRHDAGFAPAGELGRLDVPDSLHSLIAARLDALDAGSRSLLQDASVLGQTFTVPAIAALSGQAADELDGTLRGLVRKELLSLDVDPRSPERGQYGFVQALVREVSYATLSKRDRRTRHLAAARYFESLGDDELAGVLASHYLEAYRTAPQGAEADVLGAQARVALRAAAQRAEALYNHAQALEYLEQAIAVTPDFDEQMALRDRAATIAFRAARVKAAVEYAREVLAYQRERGDRPAIARAARKLGGVLIFESHLEEATSILEGTWRQVSDLEDDPQVVRLLAELARLYVFSGDGARSIEVADRALVIAERLDLIPTIGELLATKGWAIAETGRLREALALLRGTIPFNRLHGLVNAENRATMNLTAWGLLEDPREAFAVACEGMERSRSIGLHAWALGLAGNAAGSAVQIGEWDWIEATTQELDREDLPLGPRFNMLQNVAVIRAYRGDDARASELLALFDEAVGVEGGPQEQSGLQLTRSAVYFASGRFEEAYDAGSAALFGGVVEPGMIYAARAALWLRDPVRIAKALASGRPHVNGAWLDASRRTLEAGAGALAGRREEAVAAYIGAIGEWENLDLPFELAQCQLEYVTFLGPSAPDAAELAAAARSTFDRLGARVFLERLDDALRDEAGPTEPELAPKRAVSLSRDR